MEIINQLNNYSSLNWVTNRKSYYKAVFIGSDLLVDQSINQSKNLEVDCKVI